LLTLGTMLMSCPRHHMQHHISVSITSLLVLMQGLQLDCNCAPVACGVLSDLVPLASQHLRRCLIQCWYCVLRQSYCPASVLHYYNPRLRDVSQNKAGFLKIPVQAQLCQYMPDLNESAVNSPSSSNWPGNRTASLSMNPTCRVLHQRLTQKLAHPMACIEF
jgi:hypothetical protein